MKSKIALFGKVVAESLLSFLMLSLLWNCVAVADWPAVPTIEREALIDLYNATDGSSWYQNDSWLEPPGMECSWVGIGCDSEGHVTVVLLTNNNLIGTIPLSIGDLAHLRTLRLDENFLAGSIPPTLGNLPNLVEINLSMNQLSESIPAEIGNLDLLEKLTLYENQLTGSIPPELGSLSSLQSLLLYGNQLTGVIPQELGLLSNLQVLELDSNQLSGPIPTQLGDLTSLQTMDLQANPLGGSIPPELGKMNNLGTLFLNSCGLTGPIPPELGNMANLWRLHLYWNALEGPIPPELGDLSNLQQLIAYDNRLSGAMPPELGKLTNLQTLWLASNNLVGEIPASLSNLPLGGHVFLGFNGLWTEDADLRNFLDQKSPDWDLTQTVAPDNVNAAESGLDSILVTWDSIIYTENEGQYEVYRSTTQDGPYYLVGYTSDKSTTELLETALEARTYYYVVSTVTEPHSANIQNRVVSEFSKEVSIAMLPVWAETCTGENIKIETVMFIDGQWVTCPATESITLSNSVLVSSGSTLELEAPSITIDPVFAVEPGATLIVNHEVD